MIPLTNHHSQRGRSEVVIICPDIYIYICINIGYMTNDSMHILVYIYIGLYLYIW